MQPVLHRSEIASRGRAAARPQPLELLARACKAGGGGRYRRVEFIAAGAGAGTSTIARDFASSVAGLTGASVLLVDASEPEDGPDRVGLMEAMIAGLPIERAAIDTGTDGVFKAKLSGSARLNGELARRVNDRELWALAAERYDVVVVDAPALARSNRGLAVAEHMDAVVVVVEAEATRAAVLNRLLDLLRLVEAPLIGTVLNKRRYYIPRAIYDRL